MAAVFWWGFTLVCWGVFTYTFKQDRSRYRNCFLLFFALLSTAFAISFLFGSYQSRALGVMFTITALALLIVPLFLIHNGIVMIQREGFRLQNLLSLAFGILIGLGEISTFFYVFGSSMVPQETVQEQGFSMLVSCSLLLSISVIYLSVSFLIFMIYSLFLQIIPRKKDFDYLIIHGAGLIHGDQVSRLLGDRLDKAIDVYHKDPTPPMMIPSGGQGGDETVSEASAMAGYLREKDIPEEKIILEDRSTTTFENLKNSKAIIDAREGSKYTALVTSNYHVYRALRYCRRVGMDCTGIGSKVAFYYWPSALIREFIAIHAEKKHLAYLIGGWILTLAPFVYLILKLHS